MIFIVLLVDVLVAGLGFFLILNPDEVFFFPMLSALMAVAFSAIARIFYLCGLALACAVLKQITFSPKGKTI